MPQVDIPFPTSSMPGQKPGEGQGRLLNVFAEVDGEAVTWRPVPGLVSFADTLKTIPRGSLEVGGNLYTAYKDVVLTVTSSGVVTLLTGALSGEKPVTWARNNKATTPDVIVVSELGAFVVTPTTVSALADPDLPQPNSVSPLGGYFVYTIGDGRIFASDLNTTAINALSFATAESNPDGLLRGVSSGGVFYAMGPSSIEIWRNVGTSPFPLARDSAGSLAVGLLGANAVAGAENGWDGPVIFVAADGTVRRLNGYQPEGISTKDVELAIAKIGDTSQLLASVYVVGGNPIWSLSSPSWTWEYNTRTGSWHERASYNLLRWRASTSVKFGNKWLVGDTLSGTMFEVSGSANKEDALPLVMTMESGPCKGFPARVQTPAAYFDFTTGQGSILGTSDETDPSILVSWSHDGGATWSDPVQRLLLGREGEFSQQVRVNRAGLSTHHGIRWRLVTSSPVYRAFRGGRMDALQRRAA
jgi:hypothetical protein